MSRTVQTQVTDAEFYPTSSVSVSVDHVSSVNNGYNPFDHNSNYGYIYLVTGANNETKYYYCFDPQIPADATINSVTCYARASISATTGVASRTIQLCSDTTAKGTAVTLGTSVSTITSTDLASGTTWTASEINQARLYLYAKRSSSGSNVSSSRYLKFYGATLTVTYTYNQIQYEVTWTNYINLNTASVNNGTASSTGTVYVNAGEQMVFTIYKNSSTTLVAGLTSNTSGQEQHSIVGLTNPSSNIYQYTEPNGISRDIIFEVFEPCYIDIVNLLSTLITNITSTAYSTFQSDRWCVRSGQGAHIIIYGSLTAFNTNTAYAFTDNDQNCKTSISYNSGYTEGQYVMGNITENHTLVFFSVTVINYAVDSHVASNAITANTVSATSQYGNYCEYRGTSGTYGKYYYVYPNSTVTVTWNGDLTHCSLTNNGTNVKSSASYTTSSGSYAFAANNGGNNLITITRNAIITCDSEVTNAYFLGDGNGSYSYTKDVTPGYNYSIYINNIPISNSWEVKDNNSAVTSSLVSDTIQYQGNTVSCWRLTLSHLSTDHTIEVLNVQVAGNKIFIKVNGQWREAANVFCKVGGIWYPINKVWKKSSGTWQEQSDISAMFNQQNTLYLKP